GNLKGLADDRAFRRVRERLPERSMVSLFVNPRFLETLRENRPKSPRDDDEPILTLLAGYVGALEYLGAAVEWNGAAQPRRGLMVQSEEALDPDRIPAWLRRWAARPSSGPRAERVPPDVLAIASLHVDFGAVEDAIRSVVPATQQHRLEN